MPFFVPEGEGAGSIEILANWILEAWFLSGACSSPVLLRSAFELLQDEKGGTEAGTGSC